MTTNSARYFSLSTDQKLSLDNESLEISIQIEAAERGVQIPICLSDALKQEVYTGHSIPPDSTALWEIVNPKSYGPSRYTGLAFKSQEEAEKACEGALEICDEGYGDKARKVIKSGSFAIQKQFVSLRKATNGRTKINEYEPELEAYEKLVEEVNDDLRKLRQHAYDTAVTSAKREKFLILANGDEETAKRFWANIEKSEWPTA